MTVPVEGAVMETVGEVVSMVTVRTEDAEDVLPAMSVSLNVMELAPEAKVPVVRENTELAHVPELPEEDPSS